MRGKIEIRCPSGQLRYEWRHLLRKLRVRNSDYHRRCREIETPEPHPVFVIEDGPIAAWERSEEGKVPAT